MTGVLHTLWPFLVGLGVGAAIAAALRLAPRGFYWAGCVWIGCVAGGMLVRHLDHQGTAPAFVVVAIVFLGLVLFGWRVLAARVRRSANPA